MTIGGLPDLITTGNPRNAEIGYSFQFPRPFFLTSLILSLAIMNELQNEVEDADYFVAFARCG